MQPVLIIRHIECEGPGYLAQVLEQDKIPYSLVAIDQGTAVPEDIRPYSGLVLMGGPMSVNDALPWIEVELALIRQAEQMNLPVLGHCLGGQLICVALGGSVSAGDHKEIGWHKVTVEDNPLARQWCRHVPDTFTAFHWHGETFSIPPGATRILGNQNCRNQAFVKNNILAFQCHVEMTGDLVHTWANQYRDELKKTSPTVQSARQITHELETRILDLQAVARVFYQRWLALFPDRRH